MSPVKLPNLDLLVESAGRVLLLGEERDIMPLDGGAYRLLYELEEAGNTDVRPLYDVVRRLVPSLSAEQVDRLTAKQVGAILAIAGAPAKSVEDQFPNSDGPTPTNVAAPAPV